MGWKGTVRSIRAASRSIDRESQRKQRELEKEYKRQENLDAQQQADYEVAVYENHIDVIHSVHKEWGDMIDWRGIVEMEYHTEPEKEHSNENNLKIGFISKLLGRENKLREAAQSKDNAIYDNQFKIWNKATDELRQNKELAKKLFSEDDLAKLDFINELNPFDDIGEIGATIDFEINENSIVEVDFISHGKNVVPIESKALLKSGMLSVKKLTKSKFNDIYQDYVSSCILRIGNELLAILPDDLVLIHAIDEMLNTKTGHFEKQCIVSIAISRQTIGSLNLDLIDPSDSLENFVHNMSFKKTSGFSVVEKLTPSSFAVNN